MLLIVVHFVAADLLDSTDTAVGSTDLAVVLGSTFGCLAFVLLLSVIFVLAYKYKTATIVAQVRQRPRLPRPLSSIQVQPLNNDDSGLIISRQMPPAYEAIEGSSSSSQPPGYNQENNYSSTSGTSYPTKCIDEKPSGKKIPLGDNADMVSNANIINSSNKSKMSTSIGDTGTGDITVGPSGALQPLNPAGLDTGKHGAVKIGFEAGPLPEKKTI